MYEKEWASELPLGDAVTLLERFHTWARLDLGSVILNYGEHPNQGPMIILSTMCGRTAAIYL